MKKILKVLSLAIVLALLLSLNVFPVLAEEHPVDEKISEPEVVVFPVDRTSVLAGNKFDLKVELNHIPSDPTDFVVKINDQDATDYLAQEPREEATTQDGVFKMWEFVSFDEAGEVTVSVNAEGADWELHKEVKIQVRPASEKKAKNVILLIGDGMGDGVRNAARMVSRRVYEGRYDSWLHMEDMDALTKITTSGLSSLVTDSANSASSYATGHKTSNNALGCYTFNPNDENQVAPKVTTIIELAKMAGMSTGIVSTAEIVDATPAAMYSHSRTRYAKPALVDQMLEPAQRPDVILGGGASYYWPQSTTGSKRSDEHDRIADFEDLGYSFVGNRTELEALDTQATDHLLGLFAAGNMNVYIDREIEKNPDVLGSFPDQPGLMEMTQAALDILSKNENGFFLMVEGASIDKQLHAMHWERAIWDTIEFDNCVGIAKDFATENGETLVIVVADHSHSFGVYGTVDYSKSGRNAVRTYADAEWPTYRDTDGDGFPDSGEDSDGDGIMDKVIVTDIALAIAWGNHPDYIEDFKYNSTPGNPAVDVDGLTVANFSQGNNGGIFRTGNLPMGETQEVHSADDVPLTASGPGSEFFAEHTIMDNTEVFFGMVNALGLNPLELNAISPDGDAE